jgi:hypothetical protein
MKKEGNENKIWYSVLVDAENSEATGQRTNGKRKLVLYSINLTIWFMKLYRLKLL